MMSDSSRNVNARLFRSLREHGLPHTLRAGWRHAASLAARVLDLHFDLAFGTDTRKMVENADLRDVTSPNLVRGIRYEPTRALAFRRVMRAARVDTGGGFVDLGCGKGRTLILAALCGFTRVKGIDYSRALCAVAERNLAAFRARSRRSFRSSVVAMDAADYAFTREDTVVYLYNPFDAGVLAAVLARLHRSLQVHPRKVWIVYHNPVWRSVIESGGDFERVGEYRAGGGAFAVYRTRA
jgi:SAM-dependent methyltransferase